MKLQTQLIDVSSQTLKRIPILIIAPGGVGPDYHGPGIALYRLLTPLQSEMAFDVVHASRADDSAVGLSGAKVRCGPPVELGLIFSLGFAIRASWYVLRNRQRYQVVVLSMANILTLIPGAVASIAGVPVVLRVAAIAEISSQSGGRFGNWLKRLMMKQPSAHLAISETIKWRLEAIAGAKSRVTYLPNTVDIDRFNPVPTEVIQRQATQLGLSRPCDLIVVCVGAVTPRKGQKLLVEALQLAPEDISLLLVGPIQDPIYWASIEELIDAGKLRERVTHIPFMTDVERAYQAGHIFALPSSGEGLPNAMLEAMSCGLVPIGSKISGIDELVRTGCGQFVDRTAQSVASALSDYHADRHRLLAERKAARSIIEGEYTSAKGREGFASLINELVAGVRP